MTINSIWKVLLTLLIVPLSQLLIEPAAFSQTDDVPRITVQELKAKMDGGKDVVIIDTRLGHDYEGSKIKIKGAIRISFVQLEDRYKEIPANKEIVTYCT